MKLRLDKLAGMAALEARASAAYASLSSDEQRAYTLGTASVETAAPRPVVKKPVPPKPGVKKPAVSAKRNFNRSVKKHFSTGRQLSSAHKKAISEGLKRWHAAHGNGNYSGHQRRHAINHINKHIQKRIEHHQNMHTHHKAMARRITKGQALSPGGKPGYRKVNGHGVDKHRTYAAHHLKMANHLKRALLPLPGKK